MEPSPRPARLTLGSAEGVIPTKWARIWADRFPRTTLDIHHAGAIGGERAVREGAVDAAILRLPVSGTPSELHAITLYEEVPVVVFPKDHFLAAADEVLTTDLAGEALQQPVDGVVWEIDSAPLTVAPPPTTADAIQLVAAGAGVMVVPMSLARLHARKDLTYRPIADLPRTPVGLVWLAGSDNPLIEDLIGVLRGRTERSTRGGQPRTPVRRTAAEKAAARREYLATQRGGSNPPRQRGGRRGRR